MSEFDDAAPTRVVFGAGAAEQAGAIVAEFGTRAYVVTDRGLVAAGHVDRFEQALQSSGIEIRRFDAVRENPTEADVQNCVAALGDDPADVLIGFGGGSSIDVAKGCAMLLAGGGRMAEYRGKSTAKGDLLPILAIPTTAGTGSEVQSFALIGHEDTHEKMACGDPQLAPRVAILDPKLTVTQPAQVTACTGLDALVHAVESAVTRARTPVSDRCSTEAFRLIDNAFPRVLSNPNDLDARSAMLRAAALAGVAIEHGMLGAAHSMANPLTARYGITHGHAVALALPFVIRFNADEASAASRYAELARAADLIGAGTPDADAAAALATRVDTLVTSTGLARTLSAYDLTPSDLDELSDQAAAQWTAQFNPRPITRTEFRELYAAACLPESNP